MTQTRDFGDPGSAARYGSESCEDQAGVGRRNFVKMAAAAAAGIALVGITRSAAGAQGGPPPQVGPPFLQRGVVNTANALTSLISSVGGAFLGRADNGRGVEGVSVTDVGVFGQSDLNIGVAGHGGERGVHGFSAAGIGVRAASNTGTGVSATSGSPPPSPPSPPAPPPPIAVLGESFNPGGVGVVGKGPEGGVAGFSETGIAVKADAVASIAVAAKSEGAQGVLASTDALNAAAIEGVATNASPSTFNTGVFGRVERGHGVQGFAGHGIGVKGQSEDPSGSGIGVLGDAAAGVAVKGFSRDTTGIGIGVLGEALAGVGLKGFVGTPGGFGAIGEAPEGSGIFGTSVNGNGLHGYSVNGLALYAQGRAWFDSLVLVPIQAGATSGSVTGVTYATGGSYAIATVQGGSIGTGISHVHIPAAGTVEVHLLGPATSSGYAAVLVFN
jgi:hypothetical protein